MINRDITAQSSPPKLATLFLSWSVPSNIKEPVLGDLEEAYLTRLTNQGKQAANYWYWRQAIMSGLSFMLQTQRSVFMFITAMMFFIGITLFAMSVSSSIDTFIDVPSFLVVIPPALVFTCVATSFQP